MEINPVQESMTWDLLRKLCLLGRVIEGIIRLITENGNDSIHHITIKNLSEMLEKHMRRPYIQYLPAFNGNRKQFGPRRRFPNYRVATLMKWLSKWLADELTDECPIPMFDIFRCSPRVLLEHYYPFANIGERTKPVFVISHDVFVDHHFDIELRAVRGKAGFTEFWIEGPPKLIKKDGVGICYKTQFKLYQAKLTRPSPRRCHISMDQYTPIMGNDPGADPSSLTDAEFLTFRLKHGRWSIFKIYRGRRYVD